jgi:hypothetical protein
MDNNVKNLINGNLRQIAVFYQTTAFDSEISTIVLVTRPKQFINTNLVSTKPSNYCAMLLFTTYTFLPLYSVPLLASPLHRSCVQVNISSVITAV